MDSYTAAKETKNKSTTVVRSFLDAVTNLDFEKARSMVADDLKFIGVKATVEGADEYFKQMKEMKLKYDIRKVFPSENDVAVFYDINMGDQTVFAAGWYNLQGDVIKTIQVVFDPSKLGA